MKKIGSLILAIAMLLSTVVLSAWAEEPAEDAGRIEGEIYSIPADAERVLIGEDAYLVIRSYEDFVAAFPKDSMSLPGSKYILAADIDCSGQTLSVGQFTVAPGVILEGNGFGLVGLKLNGGVMNLIKGDSITFRNFHIGSPDAPALIQNSELGGDVGVVSSYTNSNTRWENCHVYATVDVKNGNVAAWMGRAKGEHSFVDCTVHANVSTSAGGNVALLIGGDDGTGTLTLTVDGCRFYGSVTSTNNSASVMGWCPSNVEVRNSENYASISGVNAGGFIGNSANCSLKLTFENCINYAAISGSSGAALVGGFAGQDRHENAAYTNCVNFGDISTVNNGAGFVANLGNKSTFTNCLNAGSINKSVSGSHLGGIVGWGIPVIEGCVNIGSIDGYTTAGNLVGKGAPAVIKNSYGFGKTTGSNANGRIIGANDGDCTYENNCYLESVSGSVTLGTDAEGSTTLSAALAIVSEKYPQYTFTTSNGAIVLADSYLRAVQSTAPADGKMNLRLLGVIRTLDLEKVGFVGKVIYTNQEGEQVTREIGMDESGTSKVHKSIHSGKAVVFPAQLAGNYIYTLKLEGLPATGEVILEFAPVSVLLAEGNQEAEEVTGEVLTIRYLDGAFVSALPGTAEETVKNLIHLSPATDEGGEDPGGDTPEDPIYPDEAHPHPYNIPDGAAEFVIGEQTYTVVRTAEELGDVLNGEKVHVILADTLDGKGAVIGSASLKLGAGSVLEGNGYTLFNYSGSGIFDLGNGEQITISNLYIGCEKKPISIVSTTAGDIGIIAGYTNSVTRWENCHVYADIAAYGNGNIAAWFGGLKGTHYFVNCNTYGKITSVNNSGAWVGYVFDGESSLTFENCTNYCNVDGLANAGGFLAHVNQQVGAETFTFTGCANYGTITGGNVGGFMGQNRKNCSFTNCVNYGSVTGSGNAGGMVGATSTNSSARLTFTSCINQGTVKGTGNAAGFVGNNQITECVMRNSYNLGDVTSNTHAGGFVSWNAGILTVEHCLNAGCISGAHVAGIAGRPDTGKGVHLTDCANIGAIRQTVGEGSATNIGGYMTGAGGEIVNCYGFGKLEYTKYPGILVCQYSTVKTASGNRYYEFGNTTGATTIGLDETGKVETLEAAVELLEARFTDLDFEIVDGAIQLKP